MGFVNTTPLTNTPSVPDVLIIGTSTWSKLNDQEKEWLRAAALESATFQRELWQKSEMECLEAVKKEGVEVIYPPKKPFSEKVTSMYEQYEAQPRAG